MTDDATRYLAIQVGAGDDALPEDVDTMTRQLYSEIRELGVESVDFRSGGAGPAGTKSVEAITVGALAVSILPSLLPKLIEFLQSWTMRGSNRTVKIKANVGDRMIDIEYPSGASDPVITGLIQQMTAAADGGSRPGTKSQS